MSGDVESDQKVDGCSLHRIGCGDSNIYNAPSQPALSKLDTLVLQV